MPPLVRRLKDALREAVQRTAAAHLTAGQKQAIRITCDMVNGEITIRWPAAPPPEDHIEALARGALQGVLQRVTTVGAKDALRSVGNQAVPAEAVRRAWSAATNAIPVRPVPGMDGAFVPLQERLQQQLATAEPGRLIDLGTTDDGRPNIAVRLGVDGTIPQWAQSVEMVATNVHDGHEAGHWVPVGHFLAHESRKTLAHFIGATAWEDELGEDGTITLQGQDGPVTATAFLCGDHMALCRLGSADQPGSTLDFRRICPCCDSTPLAIHTWEPRWGSAELALRTAMRRGERFPSIPVIRRMPDILHGVANSVKRLGYKTQQFLQGLRRWRKVTKPKEDQVVQELKQYEKFLTEERWRNWYQAELEDVAETEGGEIADEARQWIRLWENHTILGQQLLQQHAVDQAVVEVRIVLYLYCIDPPPTTIMS